MADVVWPPLDGSLPVIPGFVDFNEKHNPNRPWAIFPSRTSPSSTESLSFADFAQATHTVAHAYRPGRQGPEGQVIGVLLNCDTIQYLPIIAGLVRAGLVPLLISPRNTAEAIANLLAKSGGHRLLTQDSLLPLAQSTVDLLAAKNHQISIEDLIPLHHVFPTLARVHKNGFHDSGRYPEPPTPWTPDDVVLILHSSGSTGLPKPVPQTQKMVLKWCKDSLVSDSKKNRIRWAAMYLPPFHAMGILVQFLGPLVGVQAGVHFTPQSPDPPVVPNPEIILETARVADSDALATVPSMVEMWAQNPEHIKYLASLKAVGFGGGPLSRKAGDTLSKAGVKLNIIYGATEIGAAAVLFDADDSHGFDVPWKTTRDWEWIKIDTNTIKPRWIPQGDGTNELHYLTWENHQPAVENLPDIRGYNSSDLFEPHPTKKGLWRVVGRTDDVIVLSSGEKIVPLLQENHMLTSPLIKGAVMFGRSRLQPGILLEPSPGQEIDPNNEKELAKFRNAVWPIIEEANQLAPTFARIFKETIIVTTPDRPLPRAGKGTVLRKVALSMYDADISKMYDKVADSTDAQGIAPPLSWRPEDVEDWLLAHAASLNHGRTIPRDSDLFSHGFDSLNATLLRNRVIGALRSSSGNSTQQAALNISQNFIFDHPTVEQMARAIAHLVDPSLGLATEQNMVQQIMDFVDQYSTDMPKSSGKAPYRDIVVVLTGSTGNLGSHILASLLSNKNIAKVYAFDRANESVSSLDRLKEAFIDRGLPLSLLSSDKLTTLTGYLDAPFFGLDEATYNELQQDATHIIHNAWKVNFNHSLPSYETQIAGARRLMNFCAAGRHAIKLLFTSSIAVAHRWNSSNGPVPEKVLDDPALATSHGYSASKYVVERLLAVARQNGLESTALRIGQLCGSQSTGAWETSNWVPILVKSSLAIGSLPELEQLVTWIPLNTVGDAMADIILTEEPLPEVMNIVHPRAVPWAQMIEFINNALWSRLPVIPYQQWLSKLEALAGNASDTQLEAVPAIKILEFFRHLADDDIGFSTDNLQRLSRNVQKLEPLGQAHADAWISYWKRKGLLT